MPKISVIMPAFNTEKYIAQAIESILGQTFDDFEFIIINDCSKDRTEEIILSYDDPRIVYVKNEENLGVAATLNKGFALAKGKYIARMDADDISLPERFAKQVAYLETHNNCGVCGSNTILFGEGIEATPFIYSKQHRKIRGDAFFNSPFAHPSVMLRASVLKKQQLCYDRSFEGVEDYHLWHKLLLVSEGHNIQEPLLRYRLHSNQVTQVHKDKQFGALLRLRSMILTDCGICFSKEELDVFARVCFGLRKLTKAEYLHFLSLGKRIIAHSKTGKYRVMWSYAAINSSVLNESKLGRGKVVSWIDLIYRLLCTVEKMRRQ